ncbi:MAG: AAA family ATPase [Phycisphaeraceae bacterium]|nr:AAA family ATPase [Phycisphaerae bacterium]MBX3392436.1 AAA family ATPase [Phycisphaeraceae bacterium]
MRTVAIVNQKGGCGKTTTAISLAGVYAAQGLRVLLVDMDPQSHCAIGLGIPEKRIDHDISDLLAASPCGSMDPTRLIWRPSRNLDLVPSRMRLAALEAPRGPLADAEDRHGRLASVLARLSDSYDLCLIDCSPAIGLLTYNALAASGAALIPVETGFFSLQGAARQVTTIRSMARKLSTQVKTWMVATLHDPESGLAGDLFDELRRRFGDGVCPHTIRHDPKLKEAASLGQTIIHHAPESSGARDYTMLASWLRSRLLSRHADASDLNQSDPDSPIDDALDREDGEDREDRDALSPVVRVVATVESSGLAQRLISPLTESVDEAAPAAVHADAGEHATRPNPSATVAAQSGIARQIAADLRTRAASRSEEMARLAQRLAARASAPPASVAPLVQDAPPSGEFHELKPRSVRSPVNLFHGVRQTRQGALFIVPLSLGSTVSVAADFNNWSPDRHAMRRNEELGVFEVCIPLPPGRYSYRLVVDGRWQVDPFNPATEPNPFGEFNSLLVVQERGSVVD